MLQLTQLNKQGSRSESYTVPLRYLHLHKSDTCNAFSFRFKMKRFFIPIYFKILECTMKNFAINISAR